MPEPIFDALDRVSTTELPAEIRNETDPKKIAAYYQRREGALRDEMRRTVQPTNTRVQMQPQTEETLVREPVTFSTEEATAARSTLIAAARQIAKVGKPYWDRLSADIESLMATMPPENQVNSDIWDTCYNTLLGKNMDRLIREDRTAAENATHVASERASVASATVTPPSPLPVEVTAKVLPGLGINEDQYRTAQDHIAKGAWPLTSENVGGKRTTIGGR